MQIMRTLESQFNQVALTPLPPKYRQHPPTFIPASIKVSSCGTSQQAGPIVQIIFVRRIDSSVFLAIIGRSIKPPAKVGTSAVLEILMFNCYNGWTWGVVSQSDDA
eukprot:scaffold3373_cov137-Cylindrotheca_fusiformis.AAC.10